MANLGSGADVRYGIDRARVLSGVGLDSAFTMSEPGKAYGPLSGIWLSDYSYGSSGRSGTFTSRHYTMVLQHEGRLAVRSLPAAKSQLSMDLSLNGRVATGTWTEQTQADGYYGGSTYYGGLQLIEDEDGGLLAGRWVGYGKDGEVNSGP